MRVVARKLWSPWRKAMGNLLPALLCLPFGVAGILLYRHDGSLTIRSLLMLIAFPSVGWLATNLLGLCGNSEMKRLLARRLATAYPDLAEEPLFVGFARPSYYGFLDPHEDVGFLILHSQKIDFYGESLRFDLPRTSITDIRFRPNPHSWVMLGRWVSIEGVLDGKPVRMLVEPRKHGTLLANRAESAKLRDRLKKWRAGTIDS